MRVIAGRLKSRKFLFPRTRSIRPVTDRAKETIFNLLGPIAASTRVLDLFAGSGSLGIEAMSRGAEQAYFIDSARIATRYVERNLSALGLKGQACILQLPVFRAIRSLEKRGKKFDLVFVDPPHNKGLIKKTLRRLDRSDIVTPQGIAVVGHSNKEALPEALKSLHLQRRTKIGQTFVSILIREGQR